MVKKRQTLLKSFPMVKSHVFAVKKTNFAKFISHGKITFLCGEKKTNLAKFISHGKITFLFFGEKKTNLAKFMSHGKTTFLCGEKKTNFAIQIHFFW